MQNKSTAAAEVCDEGVVIMRDHRYKYKFSFVMPVYNVEKYLAEAVESIIAQTMGFQQNCEIIFVNDGSLDNSEDICLRYQRQFPDNIKYIKQANAGPGAARNRGIAKAQGKYISLVDSDDKISPNTLKEVYGFFEKHYEDIDLVAIKQQFFEAQTYEHPLNYRFATDRVIDLTKEFDQIQMAVTSAFFKANALRTHTFKESVGRYAEDSHLVGRILLDKQKYGIVSKPIYFYRKHLDQASSLDTTITDKFWYLETPKRTWYDLFGYTRKRHEDIPKFIQFMVMYDLQWRIKQEEQTALSNSEESQYKSLLYGLLADIDDDVIMGQRFIKPRHKLFALHKKHNENIPVHAVKKGLKYYYRGTKIYDASVVNSAVHIEFITGDDDKLIFEGFYDGVLFNGTNLHIRVGSNDYDVGYVNRPDRRVVFLGDVVADGTGFRAAIPVRPGDVIHMFVGYETEKLPIITHRFSHLSPSANFAYCCVGDLFIRKFPTELRIRRFSHMRHVIYELIFWLALAKRLKFRITEQQYTSWRQLKRSGAKTHVCDLKWVLIPAKAAARNVYVISFRLAYFVARPLFRRPLWLVSDRVTEADDNGEIFFQYVCTRSDVSARVYFVISKMSGEYKRIKHYGKVVNYHGPYYKLLFLLSDKIISSEASDHIINAFGGRMDDLIDLYTFDFVFLQHGIIKDDISGWLNRYDKNIKLFITSAKPEYESVASGDYGYNKSIVKLTGLPRYDNLKSEPKGKLIVMPTWRQDLAGGVDPHTGQRKYNKAFKRSGYFKFWQSLISDERLSATMQRHGLAGEFYLHHSFENQIKDFTGSETFKIMQMPHDYPRAKREGSLLVTDYSSVAFDFSYLKKPVLYTHFDKQDFYKLHTGKEDYFSYEQDGFGPVVYDYEETVAQLLKMIESGCTIEPSYGKRVDEFFAFRDARNSQRIYEQIVKMDE
jgi:glycosyltransferase involved in cell wall biosynthesis